MSKALIFPPDTVVARVHSPIYREIVFDPKLRKFFWNEGLKFEFDKDSAYGSLVIKATYAYLNPEEIAAHIDDDTMAKCLALAINPAR